VLSFDTEQERQDYIVLNDIVVESNSNEQELPDSTWTNAEIRDYLTQNGIKWTSSMTKAQLLSLL